MDGKSRPRDGDFHILDTFVRYYLASKSLSPPTKPRAEFIRQVYLTLQFIPFFLSDSLDTQDMPWDYDNFWWLWNGINVVTRLERAMRLLGLSPFIFLACACIIVGARVICMFYLVLQYAFLTRHDFDRQLISGKFGSFTQFVHKVDRLIGALMSFYCPIVLLSFFTSASLCMLTTCDSGLSVAGYRIVTGLLFPVTALLVVFDRTYLATVDWGEKRLGSVSSAGYSALFVWLDVGITLAGTGVAYSSHDILNCGLLLVLSSVRVLAVYMYLPYHQHVSNCFESIRGFIVIWGVVLVIAGTSYDTGHMMPVLALLLITPMLFYFNSLTLRIIEQVYLHPKNITAAWQLEHVIRGEYFAQVAQTSLIHGRGRDRSRKETFTPNTSRSVKIDHILHHFQRKISTTAEYLVWVLYYTRLEEDVLYSKVLLSQLAKLKPTVLTAMTIRYCVYSIEKWTMEVPGELEVVDFLSYQNDIEDVMECDYEATKLLKELLEEMGKRQSSFTRTVLLSHQLSMRMNKALSTYKAILATHPKSIDVLKLFISFLSLIGGSADRYEKQLLKLQGTDPKRRASKSFGMNEVGNITFVVSLEDSDFGVIRWARAVDALGYRPAELIGSSYLLVIPEPIRSRIHIGKHNTILRRAKQEKQHPVAAYEGSHMVHICNRNGSLSLGRWIVRLANERLDGALVVVATIQIVDSLEDIAFVDLNSQRVTAMVGVR